MIVVVAVLARGGVLYEFESGVVLALIKDPVVEAVVVTVVVVAIDFPLVDRDFLGGALVR